MTFDAEHTLSRARRGVEKAPPCAVRPSDFYIRTFTTCQIASAFRHSLASTALKPGKHHDEGSRKVTRRGRGTGGGKRRQSKTTNVIGEDGLVCYIRYIYMISPNLAARIPRWSTVMNEIGVMCQTAVYCCGPGTVGGHGPRGYIGGPVPELGLLSPRGRAATGTEGPRVLRGWRAGGVCHHHQ